MITNTWVQHGSVVKGRTSDLGVPCWTLTGSTWVKVSLGRTLQSPNSVDVVTQERHE